MVGITGAVTIKKHEDNNQESINITRYGSARHKDIPPVIVVCEDRLAETVIGKIGDLNITIIRAGSWNNFTTLLYGINFYKKQMDGINDLLPEIVCVIDGDISKEDIINRIKQTHCGWMINNFDDIVGKIEDDMVSFTLECELDTKNKGIPEFNHKFWLDSINDFNIVNKFSSRLEELKQGCQHPCENIWIQCFLEVKDIEKKIEETQRIINASKNIEFDPKKEGYLDYHKYYRILSRKLKDGDTFTKYMIHNIEDTVLSIIKEYNNKSWDSYIKKVKNKIKESVLSIKKNLRMIT